MTTVQTLTFDEALIERRELAGALTHDLGTEDRDDLRRMSLRGELTVEDSARVERLRVLDYLLEA
jgi:hypothetical protein